MAAIPSIKANLNYEFSLLHFNARSLLPKLDHLRSECAASKPQIVCITETRLDSNITDNDEYTIIRLDRNRHGGGVAMYHNLPHKIGSSVFVGSCKICVCALYI